MKVAPDLLHLEIPERICGAARLAVDKYFRGLFRTCLEKVHSSRINFVGVRAAARRPGQCAPCDRLEDWSFGRVGLRLLPEPDRFHGGILAAAPNPGAVKDSLWDRFDAKCAVGQLLLRLKKVRHVTLKIIEVAFLHLPDSADGRPHDSVRAVLWLDPELLRLGG